MSLFSSLSVSASGMAAQRTRAALLVENIANAETTRTPEGGPYRRKDAVFSTMPVSSEFASELQTQLQTGVTVSEISVDQTPPEKQYMPGHPDADANGYDRSRALMRRKIWSISPARIEVIRRMLQPFRL